MYLDIPSELKVMRASGDLTRNDYWRLIQEHCSTLLDLGSILDGNAVVEISLTRTGLVVKLPDGSRLNWDLSELRGPASLLVADGFFESGKSEVLRQLSAHVDLFVDVGANTGYYSVILARANAGLGIIAVEPIEATRARLEQNLRVNGLEGRVLVVPVALADGDGNATMFLPGVTGSVWSSLRDLHPEEVSARETVQTRTLDDVLFAFQPVVGSILVKIDV